MYNKYFEEQIIVYEIVTFKILEQWITNSEIFYIIFKKIQF